MPMNERNSEQNQENGASDFQTDEAVRHRRRAAAAGGMQSYNHEDHPLDVNADSQRLDMSNSNWKKYHPETDETQKRELDLSQRLDMSNSNWTAYQRDAAEDQLTRTALPEDQEESGAYREMLEQLNAPRSVRRWQRIILIALIALLVLAVLVLMIPEDSEGALGSIRRSVAGLLDGEKVEPTEAPGSGDFTVSQTRGTAPLDITFTLTTTGDVDDVRLLDEQNNPTGSFAYTGDAESGRHAWELVLHFDQAYSGRMYVQLYASKRWMITNDYVTLIVSEPEAAATPSSTAAHTSTTAPTVSATPIPTATASPTSTPLPEPIEAIAAEDPAGVISITAVTIFDGTPVQIMVTVSTDPQTTDVRLTDRDGAILDAVPLEYENIGASVAWTFSLTLPKSQDMLICVKGLRNGEWYESDVSIQAQGV